MSSVTETLKAKLDGLDLDRRVNELAEQTEKSLNHALTQAGAYVHERRDDIDRMLDKATDSLNTKTQGKYSEHVSMVRSHLTTGVDKIASQRHREKRCDSQTDDA